MNFYTINNSTERWNKNIWNSMRTQKDRNDCFGKVTSLPQSF